ncbi:hypothetical protein NL362_28270, partial [Klebsiella pneumoniae]|nr:hypothetical protein [Klebsiella pneumoniae]
GVVGTQHTKRLAAPLTEKGQAYVNYRLKKADEKHRAKEARAAEKAKKAGLPSTEEMAEATGKAAALNAEAAESAKRHGQLLE